MSDRTKQYESPLTDEKPEEKTLYGSWDTFRDFVDAMADQHKPQHAYIYPEFAVFDFRWTLDSKDLMDYLEDRSADRYTGVHFERDGFLIVLIDVAGKEKNSD